MICFPNAKINLGLVVTDKRPDGYHSIESVFYPIPLRDILEVVHTKGAFEISYSGIPIAGNSDDNLCAKAFHLVQKNYKIPNVKAHLHKIIPMGAGLGGGSADGAFMINLLNDFFELNISIEDRKKLDEQLGSDCPFFIENKPCFVTGRGENLETIPLNLKNYLVLIYPNLHMSTKEAYAGIIPEKSKQNMKNIIINSPTNQWKGLIKNQFEINVFKRFSILNEIKSELYSNGAIYASMTGSGTTVYGLFESKPDLQKTAFDTYFKWESWI